MGFLVGADEQVSKLPARRAGLREQLRDGRLQQIIGKKKSGLQRNTVDATGPGLRLYRILLQGLVVKPGQVLLKYVGNDAQQRCRWHPFAVFDHGEIGDGWPRRRVYLDTADGKVLEREVVALAQAFDFCTQKMRFSHEPLGV